MNILILGNAQAEYELAMCANQLSSVQIIFVLSGNDNMVAIDKVQNVAIKNDDIQGIQKLIQEQNISLCINDAVSSKALFENQAVMIEPSLAVESQPPSLSYADSGVSIDEGNYFVEQIKPLVKETYRVETVSSLGGFSGAFKIPENYQSPLLVAATDGVGTKLKFAVELQQHQHIGIDLVAMCVNDLIVCGAEPLFFLDYYATSKLDSDTASQVVAGICEGCKLSGCSLIGGETAEMPSIYQAKDYDLAGFSVGMVESDEVIDGSAISAGDVVIGLPSSGIHSNGYSLVRAVVEQSQADLKQKIADKTLAQWLLTPTKIYVKDILDLRSNLPARAIKGLAHITGGGLVENIPRVLPDHVAVDIDSSCWQPPAIFNWLQQQGNIKADEMWRVFNMGIGMVVIISPRHLQHVLTRLQSLHAVKIGHVVERSSHSSGCTII